jgi:hypothetical protein
MASRWLYYIQKVSEKKTEEQWMLIGVGFIGALIILLLPSISFVWKALAISILLPAALYKAHLLGGRAALRAGLFSFLMLIAFHMIIGLLRGYGLLIIVLLLLGRRIWKNRAAIKEWSGHMKVAIKEAWNGEKRNK